MIKINDIEIASHEEEYGILWTDGDESWDLTEDEARNITTDEALVFACPTLLKRHVFVSVTEVAE